MQLEYIEIDGLPIGLYKDGPVGIGASGGADSSIVMYILFKNITHDLHIYTVIGDYRRHATEKSFDNVVAKCAELTGKTNYFVHKIHNADQSPERLLNTYDAAINTGEVDIVYTGITMFPPDNEYADWPDTEDWLANQPYHVEYRKESNTRPLFGIEIPIPNDTIYEWSPITIGSVRKDKITACDKVYNPFINHNKKHIARLYKALGVEDTLFPVTRSCENDSYPDSHCGNCWWCYERKWAFGRLF